MSNCESAQNFLFPVDEKTKKITYQDVKMQSKKVEMSKEKY